MPIIRFDFSVCVYILTPLPYYAILTESFRMINVIYLICLIPKYTRNFLWMKNLIAPPYNIYDIYRQTCNNSGEIKWNRRHRTSKISSWFVIMTSLIRSWYILHFHIDIKWYISLLVFGFWRNNPIERRTFKLSIPAAPFSFRKKTNYKIKKKPIIFHKNDQTQMKIEHSEALSTASSEQGLHPKKHLAIFQLNISEISEIIHPSESYDLIYEEFYRSHNSN